MNKFNMGTLLCLLVAGAMLCGSASAGSKKFMTINAAKVVAERAIVESVIGLKIRSKESVDEMLAGNVRIDAKTKASIKGIEYEDIVYDKAKDVARVVATLKLGRVSNIVGKRIDFQGRTIKRVGFATSTPAMAPPLQAMRAAEIDAYKQLAKKIVGFTLDSKTTVQDYVLKSDTIRTQLMAAIYGAELTGYRWDQDGDAYVKMTLRLRDVEDVLGQRLRGDGDVIEVEGSGAQADDRVEQADSGWRTGAAVREGSLDIPFGSAPAPAPVNDAYGGAVNLR